MDYRSNNLVTPYTELHPESCALLVVDTQNDYGSPRGAKPVRGSEESIPRIVEVVELFRRAKKPIVHVVRLYKPDGSNVDPCRRWQFERGEMRAVVAGTWGSQLVEAVSPGVELDAKWLLAGNFQELAPGEYAMYKPRFGAFSRTPLHAFLQERGVDSVIIVGITFPNCVLATQLGATDLDYRVGLVPEACTEVSEEGLLHMQNKGVQILGLEYLREILFPR
ncbi:MAG: cysteine hydrolase [Actinobacteria bacterium]|nr:cysteine hydrolase [Actinomycetota bacterium]